MTVLKTFEKDSDEFLDYTIDWEWWLDGDTIASSAWEVESGITNEDETNTILTATIWLSGGILGTSYIAKNTITTANSPARIAKRAVKIEMVDRAGGT